MADSDARNEFTADQLEAFAKSAYGTRTRDNVDRFDEHCQAVADALSAAKPATSPGRKRRRGRPSDGRLQVSFYHLASAWMIAQATRTWPGTSSGRRNANREGPFVAFMTLVFGSLDLNRMAIGRSYDRWRLEYRDTFLKGTDRKFSIRLSRREKRELHALGPCGNLIATIAERDKEFLSSAAARSRLARMRHQAQLRSLAVSARNLKAPPSADDANAAYEAAYQAGRLGEPLAGNPHPDDHDPVGLHATWRQGWTDGEAQGLLRQRELDQLTQRETDYGSDERDGRQK
jgi:hypothetical protein